VLHTGIDKCANVALMSQRTEHANTHTHSHTFPLTRACTHTHHYRGYCGAIVMRWRLGLADWIARASRSGPGPDGDGDGDGDGDTDSKSNFDSVVLVA